MVFYSLNCLKKTLSWDVSCVGEKGKSQKQAGAELCQAQDNLGLSKPYLFSKKLSLATSFKKFMSSSIYQNIEFFKN